MTARDVTLRVYCFVREENVFLFSEQYTYMFVFQTGEDMLSVGNDGGQAGFEAE